MSDKVFEACGQIHNDILPRLRFLRVSFAAMAEKERADEHGNGLATLDGAVFALDDIIKSVSEVMDTLETE